MTPLGKEHTCASTLVPSTQGIDARLSFSVLFFLLSFDVLNRLIKIGKWAKEIEAENKKDKEEKELFIADVAHLKVDNVNLQK